MDIRHMRTLIAIAETGSFARAADAVNLTASAVSQQMQALEARVGYPLFDRTRRPPCLTHPGALLVDAAWDIVRRSDEALDAISGRQRMQVFRIGSVRSSIFGLVPRALARLKEAYPQLHVALRTGSSEGLMLDVAAGRLDAAVVAEYASMPAQLAWHPFVREPLWAIAPPNTPAQPLETLFATSPFIRFLSDVPLGHMIDAEIKRRGFAVQVAMEIDTVYAIVSCVASGLGVSIVPDIALRDPKPENVTAFPLDAGAPMRQIGIAERLGAPRADIVRRLHANLASLAAPYGVPKESRSTLADATALKAAP